MGITTSTHSSLSRRIVWWTGIALFLLLGALTWLADRLVAGRALRQADAGLLQAAEQAALLIDQVVSDRERQVRLLASLPSVVDAARNAGRRAEVLGLAAQPLEVLERRFDSTRTLDVDARTRAFLLDRAVSLDLAEVLVTDVHGFNAITTERTSDFVQSDEIWWRQAMSTGLSPAEAAYDESARRVSISVASAVREGEGAPALGVMKVVYGLAAVQQAAGQAATRGMIAVDIVDDSGRVLASSEGAPQLKPLPGRERLPRNATAAIVRYANGVAQRAALRVTNGGAWRVVAHLPEELPLADRRAVRLALGAGAAAVFLLMLGALAGVNRFMTRHIADPAAALAITAEHVAAGDLSVQVAESNADDEIGRLGRATREMIGGLRALTLAIKRSAKETAAMAATLTASSEQMAASTEGLAQTSAELSQRSVEMARTVQEMAGDATRMVELSTALTAGATEGIARNQRLRSLAQENRERLDASGRELAALVGEVQHSAAAAEALVSASQEIREFVSLIQHLARQSKLLAYTAGVEARRAGPEGAGFVIVAKEVQRLADTASEATRKTEKVVSALLEKVEESRVSGERSARAVANVRDATQNGIAAFGQVESAIAGTEAWTNAIEQAARTSKQVVEDTTRRLDALARGVETFAAAMQQVAAAAQEQSATTQEIVSTATELAASAERLSEQAGAFRLEGS
ncbi:MAG TPA: methyl-accepting chemotaxis protein [Gemmatimonadales bacterium]|jgi:methyl-accepting chemotaxis protein|nr:methyl-accepting chemotaxis protein [Gemmatimonadales bacterium]